MLRMIFKWMAKRTRYDKTFEYLTSKHKQQRIYVYLKSFFNTRYQGRFVKNSNFVRSDEWKYIYLSSNSKLKFDYVKRSFTRTTNFRYKDIS